MLFIICEDARKIRQYQGLQKQCKLVKITLLIIHLLLLDTCSTKAIVCKFGPNCYLLVLF